MKFIEGDIGSYDLPVRFYDWLHVGSKSKGPIKVRSSNVDRESTSISRTNALLRATVSSGLGVRNDSILSPSVNYPHRVWIFF